MTETNEIKYEYGTYSNKAEAVGLALTLFCQSRQYHKSSFGTVVTSITNSIEQGHYLMQLVEGVAVGVICWAMVNESVKNDIARQLRTIHGADYSSGNICFITEIAAVYGNGSELVTEAYNRIKPVEAWGINPSRPTRNPEFPVDVFKINDSFNYGKYLRGK